MRRAAFGLGLLLAGAIAPWATANAADFGHLRSLAGHYTDEIMADPALDRALRQVLGNGYADFIEVMQVAFPSELVDDNTLVASGCMQHDCYAHRGLIVIDLSNGAVTAVRTDRDAYSTGPSAAVQAAIAAWLQ